MRVVLDIEANDLEAPTVVHCIVVKNIDTSEVFTFIGNEVYETFPVLARSFTKVIGHNVIAYDSRVLSSLGIFTFDNAILLDTLILSQLFNFKLEGGHSLENWGNALKHPKVGTDITDWTTYTPQMLIRCKNDVELNEKVYRFLKGKLDRPEFYKAIKVEHDIACICINMHDDGFTFDIDRALDLYDELLIRIEELDEELSQTFLPKQKITKLKTKIKSEFIPFNPGSPKQVVERLNEAGWKPKVKTDTGKSFKLNEENLATLPDTAPLASRRLVERLLLIARLRTLEQWFQAYNSDTKRIHGITRGLGTYTHRASHANPNTGNIAAEKSIKYRGEYLKQLATRFGGEFRSLWIAGEDKILVGTDAEGIQLRMFGHYINDSVFIKAVCSGKKEDRTDPHSLNAKILEVSRDSAKTWIFAFLLGMGDEKSGEILGRTTEEGSKAKKKFIESYPGLAKLKKEIIPKDAARGYMQAIDGRFIRCDSEHHMMAVYLQSSEAILMKHANVLWKKWLDKENIWYKQVAWCHDEWITEALNKQEAEYIGKLQSKAIKEIGERFNLNCPMSGEFKIGRTWLQAH